MTQTIHLYDVTFQLRKFKSGKVEYAEPRTWAVNAPNVAEARKNCKRRAYGFPIKIIKVVKRK